MTDAWTPISGPTLGSTWRSDTPGQRVPDARAASTKSLLITWIVPARVTRAKLGMVASPIAVIAVTGDAPNRAASRIASSSAGKA